MAISVWEAVRGHDGNRWKKALLGANTCIAFHKLWPSASSPSFCLQACNLSASRDFLSAVESEDCVVAVFGRLIIFGKWLSSCTKWFLGFECLWATSGGVCDPTLAYGCFQSHLLSSQSIEWTPEESHIDVCTKRQKSLVSKLSVLITSLLLSVCTRLLEGHIYTHSVFCNNLSFFFFFCICCSPSVDVLQ